MKYTFDVQMLITVYLDLSVLLTFILRKSINIGSIIITTSTMTSNYKNKPYSKCNDKFGVHEDIP
ncbi:hypothetical protein V1477_008747 [Vespula maculifrons]|uniref:Uncharacterized protein n=1 Tax=Vespula maculifrons TaxID=7453 RepID=A0ABD2CDW2_VESMC